MEGKDGSKMVTINFGIKAGNSVAYVELFGMESTEVRTVNNDRENIIVPWDKRFNESNISSVALYRKHFIRFNSLDIDETYITTYDTVMKLKEIVENYKGNIQVRGNFEKAPYINKDGNEMFITKYIIQNVYEASENDKPALKVNMDIYYNKDSVDKTDFEKEKKLYINGYVNQYLGKQYEKYIGDAARSFYVPQQFILNASQFDLTNEKQKKILDYVVGIIAKASSNKKMYHMNWECKIVSGAEEVPFDESQLTSQQKMEIELGLSTIDDFKPAGSIFGPRVDEIRLVKPLTRDEFADGTIECAETLKEFEDSIVRFVQPETLDSVVAEATNSTKDEDGTENYSKVEDESIDDILEGLL